jgi:hypothetical protein
LFPIFEPTGDSSKLRGSSQIFRGAHACSVLVAAFCGDELALNAAHYQVHQSTSIRRFIGSS